MHISQRSKIVTAREKKRRKNGPDYTGWKLGLNKLIVTDANQTVGESSIVICVIYVDVAYQKR